MQRLSWQDYFLNIARVVSTRSTCIHRQFGCILVKDKRIIATGYNGSLPGEAHCYEVGCARVPYQSGKGYDKCRAIHAEQNALLYAGQMAKGATAYIIGFEKDEDLGTWQPTFSAPCIFCEKLLTRAGIECVIYTDKRLGIVIKELK